MTQLHQDIDPELDRIERSIDIDASAEKVWELIIRPGWWINEGEVDEVAEVRRDGDLDVVTHPKWGEFRIRTLERDEPRRIVYRWHDNASGGGTTVEFGSPSARAASRSAWSRPASSASTRAARTCCTTSRRTPAAGRPSWPRRVAT